MTRVLVAHPMELTAFTLGVAPGRGEVVLAGDDESGPEEGKRHPGHATPGDRFVEHPNHEDEGEH